LARRFNPTTVTTGAHFNVLLPEINGLYLSPSLLTTGQESLQKHSSLRNLTPSGTSVDGYDLHIISPFYIQVIRPILCTIDSIIIHLRCAFPVSLSGKGTAPLTLAPSCLLGMVGFGEFEVKVRIRRENRDVTVYHVIWKIL